MIDTNYLPGLCVDTALLTAAAFCVPMLRQRVNVIRQHPPACTWATIVIFMNMLGVVTTCLSMWLCPHYFITGSDIALRPHLLIPDSLFFSPILLGMWLTVRGSSLGGLFLMIGLHPPPRTPEAVRYGLQAVGMLILLNVVVNLQYPTVLVACPVEATRKAFGLIT
jgi:hypothetical protein